MESLKKIIQKRKAYGPVHARYEFQQYGIYLSEELHDPKHKSFYIKLAKENQEGSWKRQKALPKITTQSQSTAESFLCGN